MSDRHGNWREVDPCGFDCTGCAFCDVPAGDVWSPDGAEDADTVWAVASNEQAARRVAELVGQVRAAQWELDMAVGAWKMGGGSWQAIADALSAGETGTAGSKETFGATKQAASGRFAKSVERWHDLLDQAAESDGSARAEFMRVARLIGAKPRRGIYETHLARNGRDAALSRHHKLDRARAAALGFQRGPVHVFVIDPRPNQRPTYVGTATDGHWVGEV